MLPSRSTTMPLDLPIVCLESALDQESHRRGGWTRYSVVAPQTERTAVGEVWSETVDVTLRECRISSAGVSTQNWTGWLTAYTPPDCPTAKLQRKATVRAAAPGLSVASDTLHFVPERRGGRVDVSFDIDPLDQFSGTAASPERPSIAVIFLDATSRANFFRNFHRTGRLIKQRIGNRESRDASVRRAYTFGGMTSAYKFTAPNVEAAMAGLLCPTEVLRTTYCHSLGQQKALMPTDLWMWEIAQSEGMISSLAIKERTDLFRFMTDRGRVHDHFLYLNDSDTVSRPGLHVEQTSTYLKPVRNVADAYIECAHGHEASELLLDYQTAVHEKHVGRRVFSFTYVKSLHQPDARFGQRLDQKLFEVVTRLSGLPTPTSVLLFSDHGTQYGDTVHNVFLKETQDLAAERHLPLAVLMPPTGTAQSALAQLAGNERITIGMADLHATLLGLINPDRVPLFDRVFYRWLMWSTVWGVSLMSEAVPPFRSSAELGIAPETHPCASPWVPSPRPEGDPELLSAAEFLIGAINEQVAADIAAGRCMQVRLRRVQFGSAFSNTLKLTKGTDVQFVVPIPLALQ